MPSAPTPSIHQRVEQRRRPSDLSLSIKLGAVAAVAALSVIVGSVGVYLVREFGDASALVSHTREVQQTLAFTMQRLTDAETGQRGYLLTGSDEFLQPYRGATADVTQSLARLRTLVSDNERQVRALQVLTEAAGMQLTTLNARLEDRRESVPVNTELLRSGKVQMDSVRAVLGSMQDTEFALLAERERRSARTGLVATAVILIGSLVACALLLLISGSIRRDVAQRAAARLRIEEQNTELEAQAHTLSEQQIELEQQLEESQVIAEDLEAANLELHRITRVAEEERAAAIEARDRVHVSEARYRFLADTIPVQVWTADAAGQLDFVSEGVADFFGRSREEILGEGWLHVLHPEDVSAVVERWTHSLATGQPYEVHFRLRRADGVYRWHLGRAVALRDTDGAVASWFGSNTDIDDQSRASEERDRLMRNLERTNQELDQFAYVASHDLKAPLRGIGNLSEWIEEDIGPSFPPSAREKMELLRGRVRRLESLIDGILEYSRAGRARKPPSQIDMNALVDEVLELLSFPATVQVEVQDSLPQVTSERVPLQQVFGNLLGNAVKYSGRADAQLRLAGVRQGAFVHFSVSDNGPGIAPQYHERIFVVFQRLAARDKIEGTGIGLAIVKKIVETRGGRVWVQSPTDELAGTGTTFHFTWPIEPDSEQ